MIVDDRLTSYIHSLDMEESPVLAAVGREARADNVPIIRQEMVSFLRVLIMMKKPMNILEVGTAVGYSALLMSECIEEGAHITTIENYDKRIPVAKANFKRAGKEDVITLLEGDAKDILPGLEGPYDFIFMDAAKGQYINFLPDIRRLLGKGGILLSDNVFQDGSIVRSRFAISRRDRTIHARMREYLWELKHCDYFETSLLTVGDGVSLSIKK